MRTWHGRPLKRVPSSDDTEDVRAYRVLWLSLILLGLGASTSQAGFGCSASAGRLTVLGQKIEPVRANAGNAECSAEVATLSGDQLSLPTPLSANALVSATEFYPVQRTILASGGLADLRVKALPDLPIALPTVAIPAAIRTALSGTVVDLAPVKAAIPVLPTNLPTNLSETLGVGSLLNGVPLLDQAAADAANAANAATNAANRETNAVNAAVNALRAAIPDTIALDDAMIAALLTDLRLPDVDLLRIRGAMAYANASCQSGAPTVLGTSKVAGISVLGQELPVDQVIDTTRTVLAAAPLDVTNLTVSAADLGLSADQAALVNAAASTQLTLALQAVTNTIKRLASGIQLPEVLAQIKVTPGAQVRTADSVTQQALTIGVAIAGQQIVEAVIGEATASAVGVDCAEPILDPQTPAGQLLTCEGRRLVLTDVLQRGNRVKLTGIADPALAGQTVAIVLDATNKVVARTKVGADGSFDTTAALPPASIRETDLARYQAQLGAERSSNLKLRRRFVLESLTAKKGKVTFAGHLVAPLGRPIQPIELRRRISCTETRLVTRFKPNRSGRFRITVKAPRNVGTAVYTMKTLVRSSVGGSGLFETYMLPRAIELDQR